MNWAMKLRPMFSRSLRASIIFAMAEGDWFFIQPSISGMTIGAIAPLNSLTILNDPGEGTFFVTNDITVANTGWTEIVESRRALSAVVSAAGNGYNIGRKVSQGARKILIDSHIQDSNFVVRNGGGQHLEPQRFRHRRQAKPDRPCSPIWLYK